MNWGFTIYTVAGVFLTLFMLIEDEGEIEINHFLIAGIFGWLVGVPTFILLLVFFGNWPVIAQTLWWLASYPFSRRHAAIDAAAGFTTKE